MASVRSVSETKGMPAASCVVAAALTSAGTSGFCRRPVTTEALSAAMRTEPTSAVPTGGAEVRDGVLQPSHLRAAALGHRGHGDGAELGGECAQACAQQEQGDHDDPGARSGLHRPDQDQDPGRDEQRGDGEEQGQDEEHPGLDEELGEEHAQAAGEPAVARQPRVDERFAPGGEQAPLPGEEGVHPDQPCGRQPHDG
jgi:hypothetical protein